MGLLGRLLFPLTNLKLPNVFAAGKERLGLVVVKTAGSYSLSILSKEKPLKLTLEWIGEQELTEALLQAYFFRHLDKEYGALRMFIARLGLRRRAPLEMLYIDGRYALTIGVTCHHQPLELQFFYSPVLRQFIARGQARKPEGQA